MPSGGHNKKPTKIRKLTGARLTQGRVVEPEFTAGKLAPPKHLDATARAEWVRIRAELLRFGLLTDADRAALEVYCVSYSQHVAACKAIAKYGLTDEFNGHAVVSPWVRIQHEAGKNMMRAGSRFGLTPADRAGLSVDSGARPEEKRMELLLFGGKDKTGK